MYIQVNTMSKLNNIQSNNLGIMLIETTEFFVSHKSTNIKKDMDNMVKYYFPELKQSLKHYTQCAEVACWIAIQIFNNVISGDDIKKIKHLFYDTVIDFNTGAKNFESNLSKMIDMCRK